jgi:hypothetical protein
MNGAASGNLSTGLGETREHDIRSGHFLFCRGFCDCVAYASGPSSPQLKGKSCVSDSIAALYNYSLVAMRAMFV